VVNERLRRAMFRAGHDTASLAEAAAVSVKSVERWLRGAAAPYPRTRLRVSALVGEDESYTPLYNSIYRFDDELLVNSHVYGILAAYTPTVHIRRVDGAFFNTYLESFERIWATTRRLPDDPPRRQEAS